MGQNEPKSTRVHARESIALATTSSDITFTEALLPSESAWPGFRPPGSKHGGAAPLPDALLLQQGLGGTSCQGAEGAADGESPGVQKHLPDLLSFARGNCAALSAGVCTRLSPATLAGTTSEAN